MIPVPRRARGGLGVLLVVGLWALSLATAPTTAESSATSKRMGNDQGKPFGGPVVMGDEALMCKKEHGTARKAPMSPLRWNVDASTADNICCFNRHYAEYSGYFSGVTAFWQELRSKEKLEYHDSVTGKRLFTAPIGRTMEEFIAESKDHGWPSFRDDEVDWTNVRVLPDGETVSVDGTHLGHNIPDAKGNRYCINLVSIAGFPLQENGTSETQQHAQGE